MLTMREVTKADAPFLYALLLERNPLACVSHRVMPSYAAHELFVAHHPYDHWWVASWHGQRIGSVYLTDRRELGVNLVGGWPMEQAWGAIVDWVQEWTRGGPLLVNVAATNPATRAFYEARGFVHIQDTLRHG